MSNTDMVCSSFHSTLTEFHFRRDTAGQERFRVITSKRNPWR